MKKEVVFLMAAVLLALVLSVALVGCDDAKSDANEQEQAGTAPVPPEPETEYVVDVLNFLPKRPDVWSYSDDIKQGKTTVRVHFAVPFTGEYRFGFDAGGNWDYEGAELIRATLNGQPFDFSDGYDDVPMKMTAGSDNILELELYSVDEYGYYEFGFEVREGFEDMVLLPGEEGTFSIDPEIIGSGVKRYYCNSEDGIEFYAAYQMDLNADKFCISDAGVGSDKRRLDVPIEGSCKTYIVVKNMSDEEQIVKITEGEFDVLNAPGEKVKVTYAGDEGMYLLKVNFSKSNMRISIRKEGEEMLYNGGVFIQSKMLSAKTGERIGTYYSLGSTGEYQLIGRAGEYFFIYFVIAEAGTYVFELSEIG